MNRTMAPYSNIHPRTLIEDSTHLKDEKLKEPPAVEEVKTVIVWRNVFIFLYLHLAALYGLYLILTSAKVLTSLWGLTFGYAAGLGITAGAHRLWAHRTYKARLPLRIFLALLNVVSLQNSLYEWVRDHRVHHKFTDTNADPHNATRGFFFSHVGWLLVKKHPDVKTKGKTIDMSDVESDPVVKIQRMFYVPLVIIFCFYIPAAVPVYCWGETWKNSFFIASIFRYVLSLNNTWLVNSAAHIWGNRPYDQAIKPAENKVVSALALGEGWHNYHHVFPWDYKTAELGDYSLNWTTAFIDFCAKIGLAYDLKSVPAEMVMKRIQRTGLSPHVHSHEDDVWGLEDKDAKMEDIKETLIINRRGGEKNL